MDKNIYSVVEEVKNGDIVTLINNQHNYKFKGICEFRKDINNNLEIYIKNKTNGYYLNNNFIKNVWDEIIINNTSYKK
jgi:hypothetical protein